MVYSFAVAGTVTGSREPLTFLLQAGDVRAGAADHCAFADDGLLALARQRPGGERVAA